MCAGYFQIADTIDTADTKQRFVTLVTDVTAFKNKVTKIFRRLRASRLSVSP